MKARVKILVNGAAATLLTGAVAAGLIISSTGALQTKNNDVLAARELDETQEEMTREQEPQTEANAELVSAERYQLGMLWEHELTAKKTTEKSTESDEKRTENEKRSSSASSASSPLASYFSDQALVNPNTVGNYLNVRAQADENADVVNTIQAEELVSVLGEDGDWTKIGIDDMEGWVKNEYLLTGEEAAAYMQENGTLYARVTVPNMNIRLRPTTSADILDVAYEYDAYEVSLLESGWAYCVYDGPMKGYLSADCLAVSYSLGETWINTDIALTEENAKQLGVAVSESSAENIVLASANKVNVNADISTKETAAGNQEVLTVLSPDQVMAMASQAETVSSQQEESKVQQDTVPSSSAATNENGTANSEVAAPSEPAQQPSSDTVQPTVPETQPSSETIQPTVPETQPSTEAVTVTGIEAFYVGGTKSEGDVVCSNEVYVVAAYSDGNYATITEGWSSNDIGMMLHAGENVITLSYGGFSSNIVLTVAAASSAAPTTPETQPAAPETQPAAPETQPAAPETQPTVPETQPSQPTGSIRVTNVALSSDLTQYTLNLCSQYGVDSSVIFSVMYHESHFNAGATSGSGAQGLMQIIPRYSASRMAKLGVTNLYDPASNILVGIDLLAEYYHTYGSWNQALTAYRTGNAGNDSAYAATILGSVGMFQTVYYE
ncbi:MAG: transglycosylase SLT domain-containing protein [Lachnospiraceae bacterium]